MADRRARTRKPDALTAAGLPSLVAAATRLSQPETPWIPTSGGQDEAWNFYRSFGELNFAIGTWFANGMSRVRLIPAVTRPGEDPAPIDGENATGDDAVVARLVHDLGNGIGGQSALLKRLAILYSVPGEAYLVGEEQVLPNTVANAGETIRTWNIYSAREIRENGKTTVNGLPQTVYEVQVWEGMWRRLSPESYVTRLHRPDAERHWQATSPVIGALTILREIDFYNRYIVAMLLSRTVMNGFLMVPSEVTFPAKEQYKDAPDPFVAELIDIGTRAIRNPGTASAAFPMPLKVPAAMIEKFKHLTFSTEMTGKVVEDREKAFNRLATAINVPAEIMSGRTGDMNHWGQWQLEESAIKLYFSPEAEMLCADLTTAYLYAMMNAEGISPERPDGTRYVLWYDPSNLAQQPDRTSTVHQAFTDGVLKEDVRLRETGFEPGDDMPSMDEFKTIALKRIALGAGPDALTALAALTGDESLKPPAPPAGGDPGGLLSPPPRGDQPPAGGQVPGQTPKTTPPTRPAALLNGRHVADRVGLSTRYRE